jgi:GR25 family glycosyltransferase involved in LPS biosynthesis
MTKINYKKINYKKYFDKIYCINLNQRPERWENCLAEFKKHNIKVERFSAIDGTKVEHYDNINIGAAGCFMSHLSIFKEMVKNNWSRVLILEDDVVFAKDFSKRIPNILNNLPPSFDVVYLGASYVIKGKEINPFLSKVVSAGTTSSYIVSLEFANKFLENYKEINCEIDVLFAKLQKKLNFFISNEPLIWQKEGFSDILNEEVSYESCMSKYYSYDDFSRDNYELYLLKELYDKSNRAKIDAGLTLADTLSVIGRNEEAILFLHEIEEINNLLAYKKEDIKNRLISFAENKD